MIQVTLLKTTGEEETHHVHGVGDCAHLIGAETLDTVNLRDGRVMILDDAGYDVREERHGVVVSLVPVRARKPINQKATELYWRVCKPGTTHQIVGDVVIAFDADFGS